MKSHQSIGACEGGKHWFSIGLAVLIFCAPAVVAAETDVQQVSNYNWMPIGKLGTKAPPPKAVSVGASKPVEARRLVADGKPALPKFLTGAVVLFCPSEPGSQDERDAQLEVRVNQDCVLFLALTYKPEEKVDLQPIVKQSWDRAGGLRVLVPPADEPVGQQLYVRACRRGEVLALRTHLYESPYVIVPKPRPNLEIDVLEPGPEIPFNVAQEMIRKKAFRLNKAERFDELERWTEGYIREHAKFPDNGNYKMQVVYSTMVPVPADKNNQLVPVDEKLWNELLARRQKWLTKYPESPACRIALSKLYQNYAWQARGLGAASTVTEQGAAEFQERTEKAAQELESASELARQDPDYYQSKIAIAQALGWPREKVDQFVKQAIETEPWCPRVVSAAAAYLLPRWYGQPGDLEKFADQVTEMTKDKYGESLYAVVVETAFDFDHGSVFRDFKFSWPKIQQGFVDYDAHAGGEKLKDNQTKQILCLLACQARQWDTARALFQSIGDQWMPSVWGKKEAFDMAKQQADAAR